MPPSDIHMEYYSNAKYLCKKNLFKITNNYVINRKFRTQNNNNLYTGRAHWFKLLILKILSNLEI